MIRRPLIRWALVASVVILLVTWHVNTSGTIHAPEWLPQTMRLGKHEYQTADDYLADFGPILQENPMTVRQTKQACNFNPEDDIDFQFDKGADWVVQDRSDQEIALKQAAWHDFMRHHLIPFERVKNRFSGRGIVVCAGNERSLLRLWVLLRMLNQVRTSLPVEVHYYGDEELSPKNRTDLSAEYKNLYFSDLSGPNAFLKTGHENFWINYNVKLASLLNSRFAEPLLLDSDNTVVSDPETLYNSATYLDYGTVFYPDISRTRPENPMWAITNTPCRTDEYEMESGQLLINKVRFWYHLQLAAHFGHDKYYQDFLLGDKDCFRFAWHALRTPFGQPDRWLTSIGFVARPQRFPKFPNPEGEMIAEVDLHGNEFQGGRNSYYCGHSFGQHYPDGANASVLFVHGGLVKTLSQEEITHVRSQAGRLFAAYKSSERANLVSFFCPFGEGVSADDDRLGGRLSRCILNGIRRESWGFIQRVRIWGGSCRGCWGMRVHRRWWDLRRGLRMRGGFGC
ncbi:glycosyltransferase family 71 protein [Piedraia hortae CBS 480.64]|uniref:Glycosyltransferase family 71 protein n=1 Tax=Piedraia hortae CBS 480.64 TaxID=1314780 RepID=A0A6A7BUC5_9PEZI|nr:glycosyltransferase family 71 protein [Piedraia hortae CBS 480.64]